MQAKSKKNIRTLLHAAEGPRTKLDGRVQDAAEKVRGCKPKATHPEADLSTRCRGAAPSGTASLQPQVTLPRKSRQVT